MHPTWTLIIVVVLAALLFMRPGKLSSLMTDLGQGIKGFRKGLADDQPPAQTPTVSISTRDKARPDGPDGRKPDRNGARHPL